MLLINSGSILPPKNKKIFLDYIFEKCDKASFCLPNFKQKNLNGGKVKQNKDYEQYLAQNEHILQEIAPYIIQRYLSKSYFIMKQSYVCDIVAFRLFKGAKERLYNYPNLFDWQYPDLPEDLCFFRKGTSKCWLQVIAHEDYAYIFDETEGDEEMLNNCGIKYVKLSKKIDTPQLKI